MGENGNKKRATATNCCSPLGCHYSRDIVRVLNQTLSKRVTVLFRLGLLCALVCPPAALSLRSQICPNRPPTRTRPRDRTGTGSHFLSQRPSQNPLKKSLKIHRISQKWAQKDLLNHPARRQKGNKKRVPGDSNESLGTLRFYSCGHLNAALKGTKLGAELGRFWVGEGQGESE